MCYPDKWCFSQFFVTAMKYLRQSTYEDKEVYVAHGFGKFVLHTEGFHEDPMAGGGTVWRAKDFILKNRQV